MRYSVLYSLPQPLPPAGAPVSVESGTLFRDNEAHCLILQLGLKNCATRPVSAVQVRVTVFNAQGGVQRSVDYQYSGLAALPGAEFGREVAIGIPDCDAASFAVSVQRVGFAGSEAVFSGGSSKPGQSALVSDSCVPILLAVIAVVASLGAGASMILRLLTAFVLPVLCCVFARKGGKVCKTLSIVCYVVCGIQLLAAVAVLIALTKDFPLSVISALDLINGAELLLPLIFDLGLSTLFHILIVLSSLCFIAKNFVAGMLLNKAYKAG